MHTMTSATYTRRKEWEFWRCTNLATFATIYLKASIHTQPTSTRDTIHQLISGFPKNNAAKLQEAINIIQAFQVLLRKLNTTTGFLDILRP